MDNLNLSTRCGLRLKSRQIRPIVDFDNPDLSAIDGFDAAWGPRADAPMGWTVSAYGGDFAAALGASLGHGAAPEDGTQVRFASRSGGSAGGAGSSGALRTMQRQAARLRAARVRR